MRWVLCLILLFAAGDAFAAAATSGGACRTGLSAPSGNTDGNPAVTCTTLCYITTDAGSWTCGPVYVPKGGVGASVVAVRASVSAAAGCDYDDFTVYETNESSVGTNTVIHSIGLLDDDGSSSGVTQIKVFGPAGPYIYIAGGTSGTAGTCSATAPLEIQLLTWPDGRPQ